MAYLFDLFMFLTFQAGSTATTLHHCVCTLYEKEFVLYGEINQAPLSWFQGDHQGYTT